MMKSSMRIAGAALLLGMAIGAQAQITKVGSAYKFRMKHTPGKTITQNVSIATSIAMGEKPMVMNIVIPTKMKCTGQKGTVYTVAVTSGPMSMGGKPFNGSKAETTTVKINDRGQMVDGNGPKGVNFNNMELPEKPLAVGATWTGKINMPQGQGQVDAKYKFNGIKIVNGKQVAVIGVSMTMDGMMGKMTGSGTMNLLVADGQPLNMNVNMAGTVNAAQTGSGSGMKTTMTIKMARS